MCVCIRTLVGWQEIFSVFNGCCTDPHYWSSNLDFLAASWCLNSDKSHQSSYSDNSVKWHVSYCWFVYLEVHCPAVSLQASHCSCAGRLWAARESRYAAKHHCRPTQTQTHTINTQPYSVCKAIWHKQTCHGLVSQT